MNVTEEFSTVFARLRDVMLESAPNMVVAEDKPGQLTLKTSWIEKRTKQPAWFGTVTIKKSYVAYHVMPLYVLPQLETAVAEPLGKRRQGKTCFNFKKADDGLFASLRHLTEQAAAHESDLQQALGS